MALVACEECDKEISNKADACPNCGAPSKRKAAASAQTAVRPAIFLPVAFLSICVALLFAWNHYDDIQRAKKKELARVTAISVAAANKREAAERARIEREKRYEAERPERERRNREYAAEQEALQKKRETALGLGMLMATFKQLEQVNQVASATPRIALSPQISRMQAIFREAEALPIEGCLAPTKGVMLNGIQEMIQAYLAFMRQESISIQAGRAERHLVEVKAQMESCIAKAK